MKRKINSYKIFLNFLLCFAVHAYSSEIRIVVTTALTDSCYEVRKQQYINTFQVLADYGYGADKIYVIETCKKQGPTFLETYCANVFYSTVNDGAKSAGVKEARAILEGVQYFKFAPDDIVIKLTGHYQFRTNFFLELVKKKLSLCDVIIKPNLYQLGDVVIFCYAIKNQYLLEILNSIDYKNLSEKYLNVELEIGRYITKQMQNGRFRVFYVDRLDIGSNLLGTGQQNIISMH